MTRRQGHEGRRDEGYIVQCWCGATTVWQAMEEFLRGDKALCGNDCERYRPLEREHLCDREGKNVDAVAQALRAAATAGAGTVVIISADAMSPHQSVVTVMEAARRVGLTQVTFATQSSAGDRAANGR